MLLASNGGLSNGGVGICRIGRGGALLVKGSVTPGMVGISGGSDRAEANGVMRDAAAKVTIDRDILEQDL